MLLLGYFCRNYANYLSYKCVLLFCISLSSMATIMLVSHKHLLLTLPLSPDNESLLPLNGMTIWKILES